MPYISTEEVATKRAALKAAFPDYKFSVTCENYSGIRVCIMESPFDLLPDQEKKYKDINTYSIERCELPEKTIEVLKAIQDIISTGKRVLVEDGDYGTVPTFYTYIQIGKYDKPCIVKENKSIVSEHVEEVIEASEVVAPKAKSGEVQIVDYSEKAIAVIGDTKPIKDKLKELGGKWNNRLTCGPGWIFSKKRTEEVINALNTK